MQNAVHTHTILSSLLWLIGNYNWLHSAYAEQVWPPIAIDDTQDDVEDTCRTRENIYMDEILREPDSRQWKWNWIAPHIVVWIVELMRICSSSAGLCQRHVRSIATASLLLCAYKMEIVYFATSSSCYAC